MGSASSALTASKSSFRLPGRQLPARYYLVILVLFISIHLILSNTHQTYGQATSLSRIAPGWMQAPSSSGKTGTPPSVHMKDEYPYPWHLEQTGKANATFVILARNSETKQLVKSLVELEDRFNHRYHYPYVFLNDEPFSDYFKKWTSKVVSGKVSYGLIPSEHWNQPDDIDEEKAKAGRMDMVSHGVIYGSSVPYRNMCRFNSGFFFRHELVQPFRYYWRVEPGVSYFCDVEEDPFMYLYENNKVYGFTISMYEYLRTVPTLWETTMEFIKEHPQYLAKDNSMGFLSDDDGETYNLCHFWSNFEIADMDFWRSEAYMKYFEYLEAKGGFYYERWGDAPVHSLGVGLFANKDQIHMFKDIGYRHPPFQHCPQGESHTTGRCWCDEKENFDYESYSCTYRWDKLFE